MGLAEHQRGLRDRPEVGGVAQDVDGRRRIERLHGVVEPRSSTVDDRRQCRDGRAQRFRRPFPAGDKVADEPEDRDRRPERPTRDP